MRLPCLWNDNSYPAFFLTKTYNSENPISNKTTGWFIPTAGQWLATIYYGVGGASDCTWGIYIGTNFDGFSRETVL